MQTDMKEELLFYNAYQEFYKMANQSIAFSTYCRKAFGEDFSQDGFSDLQQLNKILSMVELDSSSCVLDIGCGNGKVLEYIHKRNHSNIYGFDYSENAIASAKHRMGNLGELQVALIGEVDYAEEMFDLVLSLDTIYFAPDIPDFVSQIYRWLKPEGVFICGYQEGDIMGKTENEHTSVLANAFAVKGLTYEVIDYTKETYDMLHRKREAIDSMKEDFHKEGFDIWYEVVKNQTNCALESFDEYRVKNARYIYMVRKVGP